VELPQTQIWPETMQSALKHELWTVWAEQTIQPDSCEYVGLYVPGSDFI